MLMFTNTFTDTKEHFTSDDKRVKMYVCGITPYDYAHVGHGRCYVTFDVVYRLLTALGYHVSYCRNYTDIDDKLLHKAEKELSSKYNYSTIAEKYIQAYKEDMNNLNCISPEYEPRVTQHIPQIISFIKGLVDKGHAYEVDGNVYFDINSYASYGELSKRNLADLKAGARVAIDHDKKNPLDFALWKKEEDNTFWKSPWGWGRPGWHIECSALSKEYLGDTLDIHGGGMDLIFPHHENERAQSESLTNHLYTRFWIHNAFVRINQEKMSKSVGNFFTLRDIFNKYHPMLIRYYMLQHNYRIPLDFSFESIDQFEKSYYRLSALFKHIDDITFSYESYKHISFVKEMMQALCDDLNGARVWGILFENIQNIQANDEYMRVVKALIKDVLGIVFVEKEEIKITPEIQNLIDERRKAREDKDWKKADRIRDMLTDMGIDIHDKKLT
jgi:cysteinyl-tRNA synthetase